MIHYVIFKRMIKPRHFVASVLFLTFTTCVCIMWVEENYFRLPLQDIPNVKWCKQLTKISHPWKPVGLVSFPGSGSTWLRILLQQATGIGTGSLYNDFYLRIKGFPGEAWEYGTVLVVKNHYPVKKAEVRVKFSSIILLIRQPRDSILAEYNRQYGTALIFQSHQVKVNFNVHMIAAPPSVFKKSPHDWSLEFSRLLEEWTTTYIDWLTNYDGPIHVVFYENLVHDTRNELQRILNFVNVTVSEWDMTCALDRKNILDHIYRRPRKYKYFDPFTEDMYKRLELAKKSVYDLVKNITGVIPLDTCLN